MAALDAVVRAGKVRYLGASSMYAWQFAKAQNVVDVTLSAAEERRLESAYRPHPVAGPE